MPAQGYLQPCKPSKQSLGGVEVFMLVLCRDNQAIPGNPLIANVSQGRGGNPPNARDRQQSSLRLPSLRMATQGDSCPLRTDSPYSTQLMLSFSFIPVKILAATQCPRLTVIIYIYLHLHVWQYMESNQL